MNTEPLIFWVSVVLIKMKKLKLHLGCGGFYKKGYVNIDKHPVNVKSVDRSFDCQNPLDYNTDSVYEILAIHLFEHLKRSGLNRTVKSWHRVLKPGGKLILELPNIEVIMENFLRTRVEGDITGLLDSDEYLKWIFGNQEREGQYHYWGWAPGTLRKFLYKFNFSELNIMKAQDDTRPEELCFRLEAIK